MTHQIAMPDRRAVAAPLPRPVQEHLAQQLRAAYRQAEEKPAYVGDPALPVEFDQYLHRLAGKEGSRERARERGLAAVRRALQDLLFAAQLARH